jgi:hypothetical protein
MAGVFGTTSHTNTVADQLKNMNIQTSGYGRCIPVVYGRARVSANLIFYDDFKAISHTEYQNTGKGGGGGSQSSNTTYTYTAAVILGICEGEVSVGRTWVDKDVRNYPPAPTLMKGTDTQRSWQYLDTKHPDKAVGYGSTAYMAHPAIDLGGSGSTKNHSFEVTGFCSGANGVLLENGDANPADVLWDMLTNSIHGMGFPVQCVDNTDNYRDYTREAGLFVSAGYEDQKTGIEVLKTLLDCTNSVAIWSNGKLKIVPLGDLNIVKDGVIVWPANSTPIYDLTCDDFLGKDDPVKVTRKTSADAYNSVKVKFKNRAKEYAEDIAEASDLAMQDLYGIRDAPEYGAECIMKADIAQLLAQIQLQRYVGIRNEYEFKLGWRYTLLEPSDLVTLTEKGLGLNKTPVRITAIEEDTDGNLTVTAEDWPNGIATATKYPTPPRDGSGSNLSDDPGDCNQPVIFEPPADLTGGQLEVWLGTSGGEHWGGCEIWVARANSEYSMIGRINAPARHGTTTAQISQTATSVSVDLSISHGKLISASTADAAKWETLSYLDGELMAYQNAILVTGTNRYTLGQLKRGLYSCAASTHANGSKFMRLDEAVAKLRLDRWNMGETINFKLASFNKYGEALQELDKVQAMSYKITGLGLKTWAAPKTCSLAITQNIPVE